MQEEIDFIIEDRINELISKIKTQESIDLEFSDFDYSFLDRVEYLAVASDKLYPNENIPSKFGVQRGYNGGGIHSGLQQTEVYEITKTRQAKAGRILDMFEETFRAILQDFDEENKKETGEPVEAWNSATI